MKSASGKPVKTITLVGNPNVGKTTLFNALTGMRHTTANYPGVTVEKRAGWISLGDSEGAAEIIDLPGTYSLTPQSIDEEIVRHVLLGEQKDTPRPDLAVLVLDANNLERNLYFAFQVIETGIPVIVVLNMWDEAVESGKIIDIARFSELLGVPVIKTVGHRQTGCDELLSLIRRHALDGTQPVNDFGFDGLSIQARYEKIESIIRQVITLPDKPVETISDKIDQVLTHPLWGWVFFTGLMAVIFQSIFSWAGPVMDVISGGVEWLGGVAATLLPDGQLESLVVDGMIAGVGNVVIFLPQIFLLFFFIALLEDFGYMSRAAFVLDRVMKKVGLNGRAFLPLLSSFACAIPGVMATRTIRDRNDRLATILVAPLMSCSARLPVYALMIAAFIPSTPVLGFLNLKGLTLLAMYLLSLFAGLGMAALFRKTLLRGGKTPFLLELPPYRIPNLKGVLLTMWDRGKEFLMNAGTIIFAISIVLWFLASYPKDPNITQRYEVLKQNAAVTLRADALKDRIQMLDNEEAGAQLKASFAGRMGQMIEPAIKPLGFDWRIGIGLVASFAAREVLVSTLAITYQIGEDADETSTDLITALQNETNPVTGKPLYTPLVAVSLMVFFVLACQCMSTIAIVRRETNSWSWPAFMVVYMTALAWIGSLTVYQGGKLLGFH
ncbi:MAG: ferrous iron transport protein B [Candidatus Omnitrophica bacterium]|nr:ferrous iron transport protein B [Candidatus Omnitrophota bacterium]